MSATASFAADAVEYVGPLFKATYSFTTDDVLRDQRFRVAYALVTHQQSSLPMDTGYLPARLSHSCIVSRLQWARAQSQLSLVHESILWLIFNGVVRR